MALSTDMKNIVNDLKKYGTANWNMSAMTSDGKVINRCWFGLILKWIPHAVIPSWLKCKITNADVTQACPKVIAKLKAFVTYYKTEAEQKEKEGLKRTYTSAIGNLNRLIDKVNCKRPDTAKLGRFGLEEIDRKRGKTTAAPRATVEKKHQMSLRGNSVYKNKLAAQK